MAMFSKSEPSRVRHAVRIETRCILAFRIHQMNVADSNRVLRARLPNSKYLRDFASPRFGGFNGIA